MLWQDIALALGIKVIFLALAVFNNATMWIAVFADTGLVCSLSSMPCGCFGFALDERGRYPTLRTGGRK